MKHKNKSKFDIWLKSNWSDCFIFTFTKQPKLIALIWFIPFYKRNIMEKILYTNCPLYFPKTIIVTEWIYNSRT